MDFTYENNRIFSKNEQGKLLAEVTFPDISEGVVEIDHTFVDSSLRGQGIAGQLLEAAAREIREQGKKAYPTCSYAVQWFDKNPEFADIYTRFPAILEK